MTLRSSSNPPGTLGCSSYILDRCKTPLHALLTGRTPSRSRSFPHRSFLRPLQHDHFAHTSGHIRFPLTSAGTRRSPVEPPPSMAPRSQKPVLRLVVLRRGTSCPSAKCLARELERARNGLVLRHHCRWRRVPPYGSHG